MASNVYQMPPPPMGRAGTAFPTTSGTWAWNGGTQQWTVLPSGTSQVYGWDGNTQSWVPVTGGGGTGMGVTDGSNAPAGAVGEHMYATNNTTGVQPALQPGGTMGTVATWTIVVQFTLTPGDWDVNGAVDWDPPAGLTGTFWFANAGISTTTSGSIGNWPDGHMYDTMAPNEGVTAALSMVRFNVTTNTTVYLRGYATAGHAADVGKLSWFYGTLYARRVR